VVLLRFVSIECALPDHFVDISAMVTIGWGAEREVEDWALQVEVRQGQGLVLGAVADNTHKQASRIRSSIESWVRVEGAA
jgi:hypothetical protein